jgi:hypothetical protein
MLGTGGLDCDQEYLVNSPANIIWLIQPYTGFVAVFEILESL